MYLAEGPDGLHESPEGKVAPEVARRRDDRWENPRGLPVAGSEVGQPLLPAHDVPPVHHHRLETFAKTTELVRLAAVERHPLGVLAEADQTEPEVGFTTLLVEVQPHERLADPVSKPSAGDSVQDGRPYQVAGQGEGRPAKRDGERSGERPEDRHKGNHSYQRAQASDEESEGVGNQEVNVFGDALVGIVGFTRHKLHPIVSTIGQPSAQVALGEPAPPADLEHLAKIKLIDGEKNEKGYKPGDAKQLVKKGCLVFVLKSAEEGVIPLIKENTDVNHRESKRDDDEEQPPGHPAVLREPIRLNHVPCRGEQLSQASCG